MLGDERPERLHALDASADRVVELGLAGERLDQRIGLPRDQAVEEGHGDELLAPALVQHLLEHRRGEQLRDPRHAAKRAITRRCDPRRGAKSIGHQSTRAPSGSW